MVNQSLGNLVWCLAQDKPFQWELVLLRVEFAYKSSYDVILENPLLKPCMADLFLISWIAMCFSGRISVDADANVQKIREMHQSILNKLEISSDEYKEAANQHQRRKCSKNGILLWSTSKKKDSQLVRIAN